MARSRHPAPPVRGALDDSAAGGGIGSARSVGAAPRPGVRWLTIDPDHAGQRLDNFLLHELKGLPRSRLYRLLRTGQVRVNKGRAQPSRRLQAGDEIRIPPVVIDTPPLRRPPDGLCRMLEAAILHEDRRILVVNKPAGLAVHRGSEVGHGVIEVMQALRPEVPEIALVHRLDRATSGCLLLAKDRALLPELNRLFSGRDVEKRYLALLHGAWQGGQRRVDRPLRRLRGGGDHRVVVDGGAGKPAATVFRPLRRFAAATLVEARLESGRMHQIRVHAASIGHPVVGDRKYGDAAADRRLAGPRASRLMLHAERLRFLVPGERRACCFEAPVDASFEETIRLCSKGGSA